MNLFTVKEVADVLKLEPEIIRRYIQSKKLNAYKVGKEWRVKEKDLVEFIERNPN